MDNVYLTEYKIGEKTFAGPRITADTYEGALFKVECLSEKLNIHLEITGTMIIEVAQFDIN